VLFTLDEYSKSLAPWSSVTSGRNLKKWAQGPQKHEKEVGLKLIHVQFSLKTAVSASSVHSHMFSGAHSTRWNRFEIELCFQLGIDNIFQEQVQGYWSGMVNRRPECRILCHMVGLNPWQIIGGCRDWSNVNRNLGAKRIAEWDTVQLPNWELRTQKLHFHHLPHSAIRSWHHCNLLSFSTSN